MLLKEFQNVLKGHNEVHVNTLWTEITANYSQKHRHYHTLTHLENLLQELTPLKAQIQDWPALSWALFYHDIIYNPLKTNNEAKSAELAARRMKTLQLPESLISRCTAHIIATQKHPFSEDPDTNFFTDADLSILGKPWTDYELYSRQIRLEYKVYPDLLYYPGRKKVLAHFLAMERIYKTPHFYALYEEQARENLQREMEQIH